jgi:hypothetical protein
MAKRLGVVGDKILENRTEISLGIERCHIITIEILAIVIYQKFGFKTPKFYLGFSWFLI